MHGGSDRFWSFLAAERDRHAKRWRVAAIVAAVIAILLYQTQWVMLRPGLAILLAGQAGVVVALVWRNAKLRKDLDRRKAGVTEDARFPTWFDREELFVRRLAVFENACQMIGFFTLGYEIWVPTRSLGLALAIGVIYPATAYFGMTRGRNRAALRRLRAEKDEMALSWRA